MGEFLPWVPAIAALCGAAFAGLRWWEERNRNKILHEQIRVLERQLADARPKPKVEILGIACTGGGSDLGFRVEVVNRGTQSTRAHITARIGEVELPVVPDMLDLQANSLPTTVSVVVPRPKLGDLISGANHAPTLYGETLVVHVDADGETLERSWSEELFDPETDYGRHQLQQRTWRIGKGEETVADRRAEALDRTLEGKQRQHDQGWTDV